MPAATQQRTRTRRVTRVGPPQPAANGVGQDLADITYQQVPIANLKVHPYVQRDLRESRLAELREKWDPWGVGVLHVVPRSDGSFLVIDGHHRMTVMRELGYKQHMAAVYWTNEDRELEHRIAHRLNKHLAWKAYEDFKNLLGGKDATATAVVEALEAGGGRLSTQQGNPGYNCISTLIKVYKFGPGVLTAAIRVIEEVWGQDEDVVTARSAPMVEGAARFHLSYVSDYSFDNLVRRLYGVKARRLLDAARGNAKYERSPVAAAVALEFRRWYNRGARRRLGELVFPKLG